MKRFILFAVCLLVVSPSLGWADSVILQPTNTKGVEVSLGASKIQAFVFTISEGVQAGRITRAVFRCAHECGAGEGATYLVHESPTDFANLNATVWRENRDATDERGPWSVETEASEGTLIADVQHLLRDGRGTLTIVVEQRDGECGDLSAAKAAQATLHVVYR
jgi:hypothetical protein